MLATIINGNYENILEKIVSVNEKDQEFILSIRYLVEINNIELLELIFEHKSMTVHSDKKLVSLAAESTLEIFKLFTPLYDLEFPHEEHPLVKACSVGKADIVKFIIEQIRNGYLKTDDMHKLKSLAIKIAARKGYVSVLLLLCKTREHVHNAVGGLLTNGNHKQVPRMMVHPEIDFSTNDFELLKLCSMYTVELIQISRHKSVYNKYDKLPADYYRHVVDASKANFDKTHQYLRKKHTDNVRDTANNILTGAKSAGYNTKKPSILKLLPKDTNTITKDVIKRNTKFVNNVDNGLPPIYPYQHPLHEISKRLHKSARTGEDIRDMVTSVHKYHKQDYDRSIRDRKLDNFVL